MTAAGLPSPGQVGRRGVTWQEAQAVGAESLSLVPGNPVNVSKPTIPRRGLYGS